MSFKNTETSYGSLSKIIHWSTAFLVISMLIFGFFMGDFKDSMQPTVYMIHKSIGLLVLGLVTIRLFWHILTGVPKASEALSRSQQKLATMGHYILYLLLFIMPITGLFMSVAAKRYPSFFNLFTVSVPGIPQTKYFAGLMNQFHYILAWTFIVMVVGHIMVALYHKIIKDDGVFERMSYKCKK